MMRTIDTSAEERGEAENALPERGDKEKSLPEPPARPIDDGSEEPPARFAGRLDESDQAAIVLGSRGIRCAGRTRRSIRAMLGVGGPSILTQLLILNYAIPRKSLDGLQDEGWKVEKPERATTVSVRSYSDVGIADGGDVAAQTGYAGGIGGCSSRKGA